MSLSLSIITCRLGTTIPAFWEIWEEQGSIDWKGLINGEGHETVQLQCRVLSHLHRCTTPWPFSFLSMSLNYPSDWCLQTVSSRSSVGEQCRADKGILHLTPAHNSHQRLAGSPSSIAKSLKGPRYSSQPLLCQSQYAEIFYQCCGPLTS